MRLKTHLLGYKRRFFVLNYLVDAGKNAVLD
jgi:hypothetical protein